ncbi:MAG: MarR family transcriptional regulator [Ignavibacteriaceae bacterium]|nr:MarR family transcriptional regulator [Ignavibacteriaceae bacterium]
MEVKPDTKSSEPAEQLAELTYKILDSCHRKEEMRVRQFHLTQAEFRCLRLIHVSQSINSKVVAERMCLSPSRCTRIINSLVQKGFVERHEEPNDRRNMRLSLTLDGDDFLKYIHHQYLDLHREVLSTLSPHERAGVLHAMVLLFSRIDTWLAEGKNQNTVS